jgi:hypothetical protein
MNERMTKRDTDGQAMMDCEKCKSDWTGKHGKLMADCTALYCRNRLLGRLVEYEDTGLEPEAVETVKLALATNNTPISRLVELAEADKDGRVIILPCKVGDTIYFARANPILQYKVTGYEMGVAGISQVHSKHVAKETGLTFNFTFRPSSIGKTVFFTREEAERALREMEGK